MADDVWQVAVFTLTMAVVATLVMLPPGIMIAWLFARHRFHGCTALETLVMLPLVIPPVATGLILLRLFGRRGLFGRVTESVGLEIIFTWKAVILAMAVMGLPLLVRAARGATHRRSPHRPCSSAQRGPAELGPRGPFRAFSEAREGRIRRQLAGSSA